MKVNLKTLEGILCCCKLQVYYNNLYAVCWFLHCMPCCYSKCTVVICLCVYVCTYVCTCMYVCFQQILTLNVSNAQTVLVAGVNIIILEDGTPLEVRNKNLDLLCAKNTNGSGESYVSVLDSQTQMPFRKPNLTYMQCAVYI